MEIKKRIRQLSSRTPSVLGSETFTKFAVLLPLIQIDHDIHVLFEVRALHLRRQPGEICFPGGKVDESDESELHTAVRETSEELGIETDQITNVVPLDYVVSPFGMIIHAYAGFITDYEKLRPNPSEVEQVFTIPLSYLMNIEPDAYQIQFQVEPEESFPFHLIDGGKQYKWQTRGMKEYFYHYEDKVVWGLTAQVLVHFLQLLKR